MEEPLGDQQAVRKSLQNNLQHKVAVLRDSMGVLQHMAEAAVGRIEIARPHRVRHKHQQQLSLMESHWLFLQQKSQRIPLQPALVGGFYVVLMLGLELAAVLMDMSVVRPVALPKDHRRLV